MANKRQQMYQSQNQDRNHMSVRRQRQLEDHHAQNLGFDSTYGPVRLAHFS